MCNMWYISRNACIQTFLLEKTRVNRCITDGKVFHVIRYFLQGADSEVVAPFKRKNDDSHAESQKVIHSIFLGLVVVFSSIA